MFSRTDGNSATGRIFHALKADKSLLAGLIVKMKIFGYPDYIRLPIFDGLFFEIAIGNFKK